MITLKDIHDLTPQQRRDFQDFTNDLLRREYLLHKRRKKMARCLSEIESEEENAPES